MATIIVPKIIEPVDQTRPLIFLAGPIRGGGDWQRSMAEILISLEPTVQIACPCRWTGTHPLSRYFIRPFSNAPNRQLHWERHYMQSAGLNLSQPGCVLFWLGLEDELYPHPGPEPYAMDTRRELGKFTVYSEMFGADVVVGGSRDFHGLSVIIDEFKYATNKRFLYYETMESLANAALEAAS